MPTIVSDVTRHFNENKRPDDWNIYRLKTVDIDGSFEYSDWKIIEIICTEIEVYPNPVNFIASLTINLRRGQFPEKIEFYDELGRKVYEINITAYQDSIIELSLRQFPSGVYFVKIGMNHFRKFVILE